MSSNLISSLDERKILLKTVIRLWDEFEEYEWVMKSDREFNICYKKAENTVMRWVKMLVLPLEVRNKIIPLVKPIGFELINWIKFHLEFLPEQHIMKNLHKINWTPLGKIDRRLTAEKLIKDESIDLDTRCKLVYIYCFQFNPSDLKYKDLYLKMQSNISFKRRFRNHFKNPDEILDELLLDYWSNYKMKRIGLSKTRNGFIRCHSTFRPSDRYSNISRYQCAFQNAAFAGNRAATTYFFSKLSGTERRKSLLRSAENVAKSFSSYICINHNHSSCGNYDHREYNDIFHFLLSELNYIYYDYKVKTQFLQFITENHFISCILPTFIKISNK